MLLKMQFADTLRSERDLNFVLSFKLLVKIYQRTTSKLIYKSH